MILDVIIGICLAMWAIGVIVIIFYISKANKEMKMLKTYGLDEFQKYLEGKIKLK